VIGKTEFVIQEECISKRGVSKAERGALRVERANRHKLTEQTGNVKLHGQLDCSNFCDKGGRSAAAKKMKKKRPPKAKAGEKKCSSEKNSLAK